jgi:hypothetical protein
MSPIGSYGNALQRTFHPPQFGTIYKVHELNQPDKPQVLNYESIYDIQPYDLKLYSELCQAATKADRQSGREPDYDKWHERVVPKMFLFKKHAYVITGDDAALVEDYNQGIAHETMLGLYGKQQPTLRREIEARYPAYLNLYHKAANAEIQPLPFRPIQTQKPVTNSNLMAWFLPRANVTPQPPKPIEMKTFSPQKSSPKYSSNL